jgi:hypothetical protein
MRKLFLFLSLFPVLMTIHLFPGVIATFRDFKYPYRFYIEGDRIYINEGTTISIYSFKNFQLIKKFGRKGEGPKEFIVDRGNSSVQLHVLNDSLQVNSVGRISFFTKNGEFIRVMKSTEGDFLRKVGEGYVGWRRIYENNIRYDLVNLYDANLKKIKELYKRRNGMQPRIGKFNPLTWFIDVLFRSCKNNIFVNGGEENIDVFNHKGEKLYTIKIEYEKVEITDKEKQAIIKYYKEEDPYWKRAWPRIKSWVQFPDYYPIVRLFDIADHRIYIQTFKEEKNKSEFLILDLKGKLLKKTFVPVVKETFFWIYPYCIKNNKFYQMVENEETEEWELHRTEIIK